MGSLIKKEINKRGEEHTKWRMVKDLFTKGDAVPEVRSWLTLSGYGLGVGEGVGTCEHGQSDQEGNQQEGRGAH